MSKLNKILEEQLLQHLGERGKLPESWAPILRSLTQVSRIYDDELNNLRNTVQQLALKNEELSEKLVIEARDRELVRTQLDRIFNIVSEGFFSRDIISNQYLYLSAGCQKIYGRSIDDFMENVNLWYEVIYHEDRDIIDRDNDRLTRGESINNEYRILLKDQSIRWVEMKAVPVFSAGRLSQVDGVIKDITQRKEAEQKLEEQNKELLKANAELDRFVYSASHELRSPLTSIMGLVKIAAEEKSSAEKNQFLKLIETCVLNLDEFIKDIIEYSRNTRIETNQEVIDFEQLISDIKLPLSYTNGAENIRISADIAGQEAFYSDRKRLAAVLTNLLSNAVKYHDPARENPFIHIRVRYNSQQADIEVSDNGLGIAPEKIDNIFQMFYRATSTNSGTGLGLYIVKETLERIGGSIRVESEPDRGSTFYIRINSALISSVIEN